MSNIRELMQREKVRRILIKQKEKELTKKDKNDSSKKVLNFASASLSNTNNESCVLKNEVKSKQNEETKATINLRDETKIDKKIKIEKEEQSEIAKNKKNSNFVPVGAYESSDEENGQDKQRTKENKKSEVLCHQKNINEEEKNKNNDNSSTNTLIKNIKNEKEEKVNSSANIDNIDILNENEKTKGTFSSIFSSSFPSENVSSSFSEEAQNHANRPKATLNSNNEIFLKPSPIKHSCPSSLTSLNENSLPETLSEVPFEEYEIEEVDPSLLLPINCSSTSSLLSSQSSFISSSSLSLPSTSPPSVIKSEDLILNELYIYKPTESAIISELQHEEEMDGSEKKKKNQKNEVLPRGFYDDAEKDANVRGEEGPQEKEQRKKERRKKIIEVMEDLVDLKRVNKLQEEVKKKIEEETCEEEEIYQSWQEKLREIKKKKNAFSCISPLIKKEKSENNESKNREWREEQSQNKKTEISEKLDRVKHKSKTEPESKMFIKDEIVEKQENEETEEEEEELDWRAKHI